MRGRERVDAAAGEQPDDLRRPPAATAELAGFEDEAHGVAVDMLAAAELVRGVGHAASPRKCGKVRRMRSRMRSGVISCSGTLAARRFSIAPRTCAGSASGTCTDAQAVTSSRYRPISLALPPEGGRGGPI